jgi:hypothetical protein
MNAAGNAADAATHPPTPEPANTATAGRSAPASTPPASPDPASGPREVDRLARAVALLWLEVESGRRRPAAVAHLLTHELWQRLCHGWVRGGPPGRLVRLLVHRHSATLCDAVAVVARGERTGAITFRLRHCGGGWCVVDAGVPERHGVG